MPILESAAKRVRQAAKGRARNIAVNTEIKTLRRQLFEAVEKKDKAASSKLFSAYCSVLDKSAKKGVISRNTAVRRKSRAAEKVKAIA